MSVAALSAVIFEIEPWVTAMLTHPEFYTDEVKAGRVRSPVELVVADACTPPGDGRRASRRCG